MILIMCITARADQPWPQPERLQCQVRHMESWYHNGELGWMWECGSLFSPHSKQCLVMCFREMNTFGAEIRFTFPALTTFTFTHMFLTVYLPHQLKMSCFFLTSLFVWHSWPSHWSTALSVWYAWFTWLNMLICDREIPLQITRAHAGSRRPLICYLRPHL